MVNTMENIDHDKPRKFLVRYRDASPGAPVFSMYIRGFDREHAEEKFWDSSDGDDGWEILSITEA